mmetsp:Transcript_93506/g.268058  ORF Transcript_93506/g.268058 Transcript_93506/m.268058 type:complete len:599 (-) Transcript_93506:30-1826(-)
MSRVPPAVSDGEEPPPPAAEHQALPSSPSVSVAAHVSTETLALPHGDAVDDDVDGACSEGQQDGGEIVHSEVPIAAVVGNLQGASPAPVLTASVQPPPLVPPLPPVCAGSPGPGDRLHSGAQQANASFVLAAAPPPPMRGDLPADLLDEVPGELPTAAPHSSVAMVAPLIMPLSPPGRPIEQAGAAAAAPAAAVAAGAAAAAAAAGASGPAGPATTAAARPPSPLVADFAPPDRAVLGLGGSLDNIFGGSLASGTYPKAEAFLGHPIELPRPPPESSTDEVAVARWLLEQRRAESALRLLRKAAEPVSSEVALLRIRSLVALRQYQNAAEELAQFNSTGAPPFEAQLIAAQLPLLLTPPDPAHAMGLLLDLAQNLRAKVRSGNGQAPSGKQLQVLCLLSHAALAAGHGGIASSEIQDAVADVGEARSAELYALLGRHFTAEGNISAAEDAFALATKSGRSPDSPGALLDLGLVTVARGDSCSAISHFEAAASEAVKALIAASVAATPWSTSVDAAVSAQNNLSVCQLSARQLKEAVDGLEALVRRAPVLFLKQGVAQNLSSLYEFLPDSKGRRMTLRELADAFQLDDMDPRAIEQPAG